MKTMVNVPPYHVYTDSDEDDSEDDDRSAAESDLKDDLLQALQGIESSGSFATHYLTGTFVNPGLHVSGCGTIPLPLCQRDAQAITQVSKQAAFGKGDETLVDLSVRKTWELDVSQFQTTNPAWDAYLKSSLVTRAVEELGVKGSVQALPYKLLLYEEGAFFKPHKDTEKVPGMFGTLVVCLPSKHEGGQVHLSHAGTKKIFATASTSEFDLSMLAWYSDVTHEIKPVESGYRLVLTYNLVQRDSIGMPNSADTVLKDKNLLQDLLQVWRRKFPLRGKYVYRLDHQYSQASLHLQGLKGRDRALCKHLETVGSANQYCLFLATMDHTKGEDEEEHYDTYGEASEAHTTLKSIVTTSGLPVTSRMSIDVEDILQQDPFDRDPDSEEEGDFTGNESTPAVHRYHDSVGRLMLIIGGHQLTISLGCYYCSATTAVSRLL
jgi:hypothetical protein